ncbi:hypothetical protein N658DRAFT_493887 [Parathielavia hyrcaniae]|uniref:Uncharacterized protein n=1 Tax=Parathielavia hyrcaniae TaxID=113614 RepID=A0AAN6Q4J6_9PEZI|nr:hypothetical protein N658DRAFT_493887 [Parathielavia hyrcaniae]
MCTQANGSGPCIRNVNWQSTDWRTDDTWSNLALTWNSDQKPNLDFIKGLRRTG